MELLGASYLHALAAISVTFVGFSALLLVFRQTIGGKMTSYDSYFMVVHPYLTLELGAFTMGGIGKLGTIILYQILAWNDAKE
jgi:hypothetical protein